jgi:hypothetical protein
MIPFINKKLIIDPDPLQAVTKQFDHWRTTRKKRGPIPEPLWALAVSLIEHYRVTKIINALKLNASDFKKRLNHTIVSKKEKPMQFIDCSKQVFQPINSFNPQSCSIEFTCKNSSSVKLNGLNSIEIQAVISLLIGHS